MLFTRLTCLITLQFISIALFANNDLVSYCEKAPLIDHLNSINKEWNKQKDLPTDLLTIPMKFNTDDERIQLHLRLVESILNKRSSDHLTIQQFTNRKKNLKSLVEYWNEGQFPINTHHSHRQPYFIDDYGTACAVGHLLLTNGGEQLAQRISDVQNYAYIHEMNYAELDAWAVENGFTEDELAWIQPGYGEHICYYTDEFGNVPEYSEAIQPLSQQEIKTMAELPDGSVVLGGSFLHYDANSGTQTAAVFGYDSGSYISYGNSIQGTVYDIEYYNQVIYAAGDFVLAGTDSYNIAYWDGTDWVGVQTGDMGGIIRDMAVYNCRLYVGGDFTSVDGNNVANLAIWNGQTWSTTPQDCAVQSATQPLQVNGAVNTFEVYHEKLTIGGDFTQVMGSSNTVEGLIFLDDLSVEFLSTHGSMNSVNNLETYENSLVVGHDNLGVYRENQWYYPGNNVPSDVSIGFNNFWTVPNLTGISDIFYHPAIAPEDDNFFEFNNLVISANNEVHAINSKIYSFGLSYPSTDYYFTVDGKVSVLGKLGNIPFYAGNFSTVNIFDGIFIHYDCIPVQEVGKMFTMSRVVFLPIELTKFTVKSDDNKTAQLTWTSLTENNSLHYEVERRTDNEDFIRVGTVAAAGESLEEINYAYEDDISKVSSNYVYYRLKMVDKDGSHEYSEVRSLRLETRDSGISIAPNPAVNSIELSMKMQTDGDVNVHIYDMQGRQLCNYQWTYNDNSVVRERIDVSQLEAGLYLVEVVSPHERKTMKLDILR